MFHVSLSEKPRVWQNYFQDTGYFAIKLNLFPGHNGLLG